MLHAVLSLVRVIKSIASTMIYNAAIPQAHRPALPLSPEEEADHSCNIVNRAHMLSTVCEK